MDTEIKDITLVARRVDSKSILTYIGNEYGRGVQEAIVLSGGTENVAWMITTSEEKLVAKIFSPNEGPISRIEEENKLYKFLNNNGVHAPEIYANKVGKDVSFLDYAGARLPIVVMKFEELRMCMPTTVTEEELIHIAAETAKMHKVLMNFNLDEVQDEQKEGRAISHQVAFLTLMGTMYAKSFTTDQLSRFKAIDAQMESYIQSHQPSGPLTTSLIHGDLSLEHTRILPDGSVYFFDFSDRGYGAVAHELAIFTDSLYQWEEKSFERWEQLKKWTLDGYQSILPLTENDLKSLPTFAISRLLAVIKYLSDLSKENPNEHTINWIRRSYDLGEYILKQL